MTLAGDWRCLSCDQSGAKHYIVSKTNRSKGTRLLFKCENGVTTPETYPPTLPYEIQEGLGHTLTRAQYMGYRRAQREMETVG